MKSAVIYQAFPNGTPKFNITPLNIVENFVIHVQPDGPIKVLGL
jgi:hypothetical protein